MGVVNVTPDSFSSGSSDFSVDAAIRDGLRLVQEGADILDIGGESTRPGSKPISDAEEIRRVVPVVVALRDSGVPISVDTSKLAVMRQVLDAGADMINDITAFSDPEALSLVASTKCAVCVMHMQGKPRTMQNAPHYTDVVAEVRDFLSERCAALLQAGVQPERIVVDPGFGFGKTVAQNYELLRRLNDARVDSFPWLLGLSRKSMIGHVTGRELHERVPGSIAAALAGVARGARILRVHDVQETLDAVLVWQAIEHGINS